MDTKLLSMIASTVFAASVVTAGVVSTNSEVGISPMVAVTGFSDYQPPDRIDHVWYDRTTENNPTDMSKYPYRAIFFGGTKSGETATIYYVGSKTPTADLLTFEYVPTKTTYQPGYICAKFDPEKVGVDKDVCIWTHSWSGIQSAGFTQEWWAASIWPHTIQPYFYFDFFYDHCGNWEPSGVRSIYDVPYHYIITCKEPNGTGGGHSGGGQTKPDPPSSSSDPSGGESSTGESSVPDASKGGATGGADGDTGEDGGGWTLPGFDKPEVSGEAGGIKDLKPGGDGDWGLNDLKPGGDGDWGLIDLKPGGDDDWGLIEWPPYENDWGLIDFGTWVG